MFSRAFLAFITPACKSANTFVVPPPTRERRLADLLGEGGTVRSDLAESGGSKVVDVDGDGDVSILPLDVDVIETSAGSSAKARASPKHFDQHLLNNTDNPTYQLSSQVFLESDLIALDRALMSHEKNSRLSVLVGLEDRWLNDELNDLLAPNVAGTPSLIASDPSRFEECDSWEFIELS